MTARSYLYVPGDRPDRMAKAPGRGADALILDLEDAIAPAQKEAARANAAEFLRRPDSQEFPGSSSTEVWVRINSDELMKGDVKAIACKALGGISLPKASPQRLSDLDAVLGECESAEKLPAGSIRVAALIETADGIFHALEIARAPRVARLAIGEADLSSELSLEPSDDERELLPLRMQVILASSAAGLEPPVGPVSRNFKDLESLRKSTESLKRMGFGGRSAIHPAQVSVINEVFTPSEEELDRARGVIAAHEDALAKGSGATTGPDGRMIDEAVVRAARRLIEGHVNFHDGA